MSCYVLLYLATDFIDAPDNWLWHKICKNEYRRCAVIETYDCVKYLMVRILVKTNTEEHSILQALFQEIDHSIEIEKFTGTFKMTALLQIHSNNRNFYMQVKRLHTILTTRDSMHNIPANNEARRRLAFFSNSVFMKMPQAHQVEKMKPFSVLTPYNDEDVLYSTEELKTLNKDGISILYYLQCIYDDEWENFIEMMYYYRALQLLAFLDSSSEMDVTVTEHEGIVLMKYTYVVSCQKYWEHKAGGDPRAEEIMDILKHNETLRIAYVDHVSTGIDEKEYYSVLAKYDRQLQREVEIYRIKLPGPVNLGEGKPENQNHAFVFTRGEAVQTIDMNQDNYFEEALKLLNLLEEFKHRHGIRRPTILGVREHIFTSSVSSVAWFMSVATFF